MPFDREPQLCHDLSCWPHNTLKIHRTNDRFDGPRNQPALAICISSLISSGTLLGYFRCYTGTFWPDTLSMLPPSLIFLTSWLELLPETILLMTPFASSNGP